MMSSLIGPVNGNSSIGGGAVTEIGGISSTGTLDVGVGTDVDGATLVDGVMLEVTEGDVNNDVVVGIVVVGVFVDEDGERLVSGVVVVVVVDGGTSVVGAMLVVGKDVDPGGVVVGVTVNAGAVLPVVEGADVSVVVGSDRLVLDEGGWEQWLFGLFWLWHGSCLSWPGGLSGLATATSESTSRARTISPRAAIVIHSLLGIRRDVQLGEPAEPFTGAHGLGHVDHFAGFEHIHFTFRDACEGDDAGYLASLPEIIFHYPISVVVHLLLVSRVDGEVLVAPFESRALVTKELVATSQVAFLFAIGHRFPV